jgi:hypothetical protein
VGSRISHGGILFNRVCKSRRDERKSQNQQERGFVMELFLYITAFGLFALLAVLMIKRKKKNKANKQIIWRLKRM